MNSCIYHGTIRHRRVGAVAHEFQYPIFMMYLDLAELPELFDRRLLWSARRPALAWFKRADYLGDSAIPLDTAVRDVAEARTGVRPQGPIRLLTQLRYFGFVMNPVSFYYCFDATGSRVDTIVTEITNTPWNERHTYVFRARDDGVGNPLQHQFAKEFHVSPFFEMDHLYDWKFSPPGEQLAVHMENARRGTKVFDATLTLRRTPISGVALARALARHPFMTLSVAAGIYWQALRLRLKGATFHTHPSKRPREVA